MGVDTKQDPLELDTWRELEHLADNVPEAGIHFQGLQTATVNGSGWQLIGK
jgi:hypothetical protein